MTEATEMSVSRPTICIISFSPIDRDASVLRQLDYLVPHYDLVVLGYGATPPRWQKADGVRWISVDPLQSPYRQAFEQLRHIYADLVFANDWSALLLGWRLAVRWNAPLILDRREYAPLEWEERRNWRLFAAPMIVYFLRQYAVHADATLTVAPEIAQRYGREFGFLPIAVLNAPEYVTIQDHDDRHAPPLRSALPSLLCSSAMRECIRHLRACADRVAPGRVEFLDPVAPDRVVPRIAAFDIGFFLLRPTNYNHSIALPNKLFDFIYAALAVCVGSFPGMAAFVRERRCGSAAPSFEPTAVAATLNRLGSDDIQTMRRTARAAAARINAAEMAIVVDVCRRLLWRAPPIGQALNAAREKNLSERHRFRPPSAGSRGREYVRHLWHLAS